ncbi:MAG: hypothetical protein ABIV50_11320 [Opitutus sp.]
MRSRLTLLGIVIAVAAGCWIGMRVSSQRLHTQLDSLREQQREMLALESERARLRESLAALNATAPGRGHLPGAPVASARSDSPPAAWSLGEWTPCASWNNRGQATPRAAIETALWAAAGGDVMAMQSVLELDPAARSKAEELLNRLPPAARSSYVTPEALIASVTMKSIPLTAAQIAWFHEADRDRASMGVIFGTPERSPEAPVKLPANPRDNSPPTLSDLRTSGIAMLTLHRSTSGWRLVVPVSAVDRIVAELGAPGR